MRRVAMLLGLASLSGCTMGPDYVRPQVAGTNAADPHGFVRAGQFSDRAPSLAPWWTGFNDPLLDELEKRALAGNPDVAAAEARLKGSRAALRLDRASGLPGTSAQLTAVQAHLPGLSLGGGNGNGNGGSEHLEFYNAGFDASWELNLFGGQRRKVEAARATVAAAEADADDARLSLTGEVAQNYARLRDRQHQLDFTRQTVAAQKQSLALTEQRLSRGAASSLDTERLRTTVEAAEADLPMLLAEQASLLNALAILTGAAPGDLDAMLAASAPVPLPPASVAVGDPAALLQHRPDIRGAERRLAAQTARIGVARAARFPSVRLIGLLGLGGTNPSDIFDFGNLTALAAPSLQWNFLDFGRGAAQVHQAEARRDEAEATYRGTVLGALRDAEDALARFGQRRAALASLTRASAAATRAATLMHQRFEAGTATLIDVLDADRQRIAAEQKRSMATADLASDFIALQKALGLGWQPAAS